MPRRVALDIGTADPSAARDVAMPARPHGTDAELVVVGPPPGGGADAPGLRWHPAAAPARGVDPAVAVRGRPDLSVRVALELGRDGNVDTVVSASPLPCLLTATRFLLRRRTGVRDPLVAVELDTPGGRVTLLDASGHAGTTVGSLAGAIVDVGPTPDHIGLLATGQGDDRAVATLAGQTGSDVRQVTAAEVLVGAVPLVLADGAAGGLFVDTVRALAPQHVGVARMLGLESDLQVVTVGPDPATWAGSLRLALGAAA